MGKRREPRHEIRVPIRIFGTDASGRIFSEKVFTVNVSRQGAEIEGVQAQPSIDEIIGVTYAQNKVHFRVKWVGKAATPKAGHLGLINLTPEKPLWDFPLPASVIDNYMSQVKERRRYPRVRCGTSVELQPQNGPPIWGKAGDLSLGGCFVEMPIPLPHGTNVRVALWLDQTKLWAQGKVVSSTPGFGVGISFTDLSEPDALLLRRFIESFIRVPR